MNREEMLTQLGDSSTVWDFIVIGGGATGVGVALEAASRLGDWRAGVLPAQPDTGAPAVLRRTIAKHLLSQSRRGIPAAARQPGLAGVVQDRVGGELGAVRPAAGDPAFPAR